MKNKSFLGLCLIVLVGLSILFIPQIAWQQTVNYHTSYAQVISDLTNLAGAHASIAKMVPLDPKSLEGKMVYAVKISKDVTSNKKKNRLLFLGTHHAREWISTEVAFYLTKYLLDNYDRDPKIKSYIDNNEVWVLPVQNPDGYDYTKQVDRFWRKNRRDNGGQCSTINMGWGVDTNRNYGSSTWGTPGSGSNCLDETYHGASSFSEPEDQVVRNLMSTYSFQFVVTYHNFGQLIMYPWGYTNQPAPDQPLFDKMAKDMAAIVKSVHGVSYTPQQSYQLYQTSGDTQDWVYETYKIPAFTIELRPLDTQSGGFVLPASQIMPTWEEQNPAALYLIDLFNLGIISPNHTHPVTLTADTPFKVQVKGLWRGKTKDNFVVKIGGTVATVTDAVRLPELGPSGVLNAYELTVVAPQKNSGSYDVEVAVDDAQAVETQTALYGIQTSPTPTAIQITPTPTNSSPTPTGSLSFEPSDMDRDGCVGIIDFNVWFKAVRGTPQIGSFPDANNDGTVDLVDFNMWFRDMKNLPPAKLC